MGILDKCELKRKFPKYVQNFDAKLLHTFQIINNFGAEQINNFHSDDLVDNLTTTTGADGQLSKLDSSIGAGDVCKLHTVEVQ